MSIGRGALRARTRLALWYAAPFAVALLLLGALGLWAVERSLRTDADELLRSKAAVAPQVRGEAGLLGQLLWNLLENALRHTPPGGQVTLSLKPALDGALLTVVDTGEGIAAEHLPHIFERFYRPDRARSRAAGGSGLGLAICAWIAAVHGGRLEAESDPGRGTTFRLWLPAVSALAPDGAPPPPAPAVGRVPGGQGDPEPARQAGHA